MADYCQQCDPQLGGLTKLCPKGKMVAVICECCGPTWVDHKGNCLTNCECRKGRCMHGGKHSPLPDSEKPC